MGEASVIVDDPAVVIEGDGDEGADGAGTNTEDTVLVVLEGEEGVVEGEEPKAPRKNPIRDMRKRIKSQDRENKALREEVNLLKQAVHSGGQPRVDAVPDEVVAPTLASVNFDTDEYERQMTVYMTGKMGEAVDTRLSQHQQSTQQSDQTQASEGAISSHYERATELNVGDYEVAEDAAVEVLGADIIQSIQSTVDNSELLIYYLGKNPAKASKIRASFDSNPAKATFELGALSNKLVLKPKDKKVPEPDLPIDGGGGGVHPKYNEYINKITKAYDAGDLGAARAIRKDATEKGIDLPYNSI